MFSTKIDGNQVRLHPVGDLDIATVSALRKMAEIALTEPVTVLRIDMSEVRFLDSTGIGALIAIRNQTLNGRQQLILENVPAQALRVLHLTGLTQVFQIE